MEKKIHSYLLVAFILVMGFSLEAAKKPVNMIFILADDCTYLDLELYGGQAKTPHINALAKKGLKFNRCYQAAPMCSPTRHALYTGLYPVKSGAYPNHANVNKGVKSIPHFLKAANYRVVLAGKSHVGPEQAFPFEYIKEFSDTRYEPTLSAEGWRYPKVNQIMQDSVENNQPFCLFLCSDEPHSPYTKGDASQYPPESLTLSSQHLDFHAKSYSKYLAEITYFDGQVGEIMQMLKKHDLEDDTIVIVASEQGSSFPFGKWTCYEVGVASGMVISWPGHVKPNTETSAIVEYTDIVPTLLEIAGVEAPKKLDGKSFLNVIKGQATAHKDYAFSIQTTYGVNGANANYGIRTVVDKKYRYIRNVNPDNNFSIPSSRALLKNAAKMDELSQAFAQRYFTRPAAELYDIENDPYCQINLINNPELKPIKDNLSHQLSQWMEAQGDRGAETEKEAIEHLAPYKRKQFKK